MRIAEIINDSTAEVKNHFSDIIFLTGCSKTCGYCFNKDLRDPKSGHDATIKEILNKMSKMSDVAVLTGGEPLEQDIEELIICLRLYGKKVVLETSLYDPEIWKLCRKVLYSMKTFDPDYNALSKLHLYDNVIPVVIIGHPWFNSNNFLKMLMTLKTNILVRYYNGNPCDLSVIYPRIKRFQKKFKVFEQVVL